MQNNNLHIKPFTKMTKKSIFSNVMRCDERDRMANFKSVSANFLLRRDYDVYDLPKQNSRLIADSCTQTSKTILQLANMENGNITPDSLQSSPRVFTKDRVKSVKINEMRSGKNSARTTYRRPVDSKGDLPVSLPGESDNNSVDFCRKSSLMQYLKLNDEKNCTKPESSVTFRPEKTLTETFLEKKGNLRDNSSSNFKPIHPKQILKYTLSSDNDSFEEVHLPNFVEDEYRSLTNFRVKSIRDYSAKKPDIKPVKFFCQGILKNNPDNNEEAELQNYTHRRSNSFMMPTIASSIKDKGPDIQSLSNLLSPIKRGRSSSPKSYTVHEINKAVIASRNIPYIDETDAHNSDTTIVASSRDKKESRLTEEMLKINLDFNVPVEDTPAPTNSGNDSISSAIIRLRDSDWNAALAGLADIVEKSRFIDFDCIFPYMTYVNQRLLDFLRSPRSHVCRTACKAAGHLFEYVKDTRRPEFDDIVEVLLFKTADSNKFIRQDANLALDCMVTHISPFHAIRALCSKGPNHKNHLVRSATARLLICVAVIAGADTILNPTNSESTRKKFIIYMDKFINDKCFETRKYGERLYKVLCKDSRLDFYLKKYLDKDRIIEMKQQLKHIQKMKQ